MSSSLSFLSFLNRSFFGSLLLLLLVILLTRGAVLEATDLIDPTESRYAVISQEMFRSGNYLVPKIPSKTGLIPYLGKPPLHFWLMAASYELFGVEEWSSRLPSYFGLLVICGCIFMFGVRNLGLESAIVAVLIAASSWLLYFLSGAAVVDVTLAAAVSGAMVSWANFADKRVPQNRLWAYVFCTCLSLGFLIKGPAVFLFAGVPVFLWIVITKSYQTLRRFPFASGGLLFLLLVSPWFYFAEKSNPGFFQYFFLQENLARYFVEDYGDRYGTGHVYAYGSIWVMLIVGFLPWSLLLMLPILGKAAIAKRLWGKADPWFIFAMLWALCGPLLLTFMRQIHAAYVLPSVPGLAIVGAYFLKEVEKDPDLSCKLESWMRGLFYVTVLAAIILVPIGLYYEGVGLVHFSILPLLLLLLLTYAMLKSRRGLKLTTAILAAGVSCAFCVFILLGSEQAGNHKSTENILIQLTSEVDEPSPSVGIISSKLYSSYWYSMAWKEELVKPVRIQYVEPHLLKTAIIDHLVAKRSDFDRLPPDIRKAFKLRGSVDRWVWLEKIKEI